MSSEKVHEKGTPVPITSVIYLSLFLPVLGVLSSKRYQIAIDHILLILNYIHTLFTVIGWSMVLPVRRDNSRVDYRPYRRMNRALS